VLFASGEIEVDEEEAGVTKRAWSEQDGQDMAMGLVMDWLFCGNMGGYERGRDESDCTCPAITLVRVNGSPGGEDRVKCVCVVVMEMRLLYEKDVGYERESENVSSDAVVSCVTVVRVVIG
jgi:hypothetical protein